MISTSKCASRGQRTLFPDLESTGSTPSRRDIRLAYELRFLDALCLKNFVTSDDAVDDLSAVFPDGGKWAGGIPLRLSGRGWIERVGSMNSQRVYRNGGLLRIWLLRNRPAVEARRIALRSMLAELDTAGNETGSTMPVDAGITPNPGGC